MELNCTKCKSMKPINCFYKDNNPKNAKNPRGHSYWCKDCTKANVKKNTEENKDRYREYQKQYGQDNKEKFNEYSNKYYHENKDSVLKVKKKSRDKHREKISAKSKEYRKTEKGKIAHAITEQRRRARKKLLPDDFTKEEWMDTLLFWTNSNGVECAYCGEILKNPHQEHVVPVAKGGGYVKENIIPSCSKCNTKKKDKSIDEFLVYSDSFNEERYSKILLFIEKHRKDVC